MELALSRLSAALGVCARGTASPNHRGRSVSQPFATTPLRRLFPMAELGIRELQYHQQVQKLLNQRIDIEVEFRPLRPSIPTFDFHIAWRRDNQSSVLHAFLEMLREHAHAEAKDPEKTAAAKHSDRYLHRRSQQHG